MDRTRPPRPRTKPGGDDPALAPGAEHEVTVEKLVYGGDGLARVGGRAVFVPFAAPGDRLRVRISRRGRGFGRAEIVEVLAPGPARRAPRCRHFGVCGGCRLQHVDHAAQVEAKAAFVRESLRRLGGIDWAGEIPVRTAGEWAYRTRAEVQSAGGRAGFFREASHDVCPVEECPVLVPEVEALVVRLSREPPPRAVRVAAGDDGAVVADGRTKVAQRVGPFDFEFAAASFFQGNRFLVETLVREAVGDASGRLALDLYAGSGLFALALGLRFDEVVGVEADRPAAAQAMENAGLNGVTNVRFAAADVGAWLGRSASLRPDLVVLDPPRAGAGAAVVEGIAALGPPAVSYVSCDPATLARDLREFAGRGYEIASLAALDLFPQTYHVETVAKLRRP